MRNKILILILTISLLCSETITAYAASYAVEGDYTIPVESTDSADENNSIPNTENDTIDVGTDSPVSEEPDTPTDNESSDDEKNEDSIEEEITDETGSEGDFEEDIILDEEEITGDEEKSVELEEMNADEISTLFGGGLGTKDKPYLISTKDQLIAFANCVAPSKSYFRLNNSIKFNDDLSAPANVWHTPTGYDDNYNYNSNYILDGDGYQISNLYLEIDNTDSSNNYCSVFGSVVPVIKNLTLNGIKISGKAQTTHWHFAGFTRSVSAMSDCTLKGDFIIDVESGTTSTVYADISGFSINHSYTPISGETDLRGIDGCQNIANIIFTPTVNKDYNQYTISGICNEALSGIISNCKNGGTVSFKSKGNDTNSTLIVEGIVDRVKEIEDCSIQDTFSVDFDKYINTKICGLFLEANYASDCLNNASLIAKEVYGIGSSISMEAYRCKNYGNLSAIGENGKAAGVFGGIFKNDSRGTDEALHVSNCFNEGDIISTDAAYGFTAGISTSQYGKIRVEKCHNSGSVTSKEGNANGFCGQVEASRDTSTLTSQTILRIENCYNEGDVTANITCCGLFSSINSSNGYADIKVSECYNGGNLVSKQFGSFGIVRSFWTGTLSYCYNTGSVKGIDQASGLVESMAKSITEVDTYKPRLEYCYNLGEVTSEEKSSGLVGTFRYGIITRCFNGGTIITNNPDNYSDGDAAGLVASADGYDTSAIISNCFNAGTITGSNTDNLGGLAADVNPFGPLTIRNCYNIGNIKGTSRRKGSIVSYLYSYYENILTDCNNLYYLEQSDIPDVGSKDIKDEFETIKCSDGQLRSESTFKDFNFDDIWFFETGDDEDNYPYPVIQGLGSVGLMLGGGDYPNGNWNGAKWKIVNGTLIISGQPEMPDASKRTDVPWYQYREDITAINIKEGITSIGKNNFAGLTKVRSVQFPSTLVTIGDTAFNACKGLPTLFNIPGSVTTIGRAAFTECNIKYMAFYEDQPFHVYERNDTMNRSFDPNIIIFYKEDKEWAINDNKWKGYEASNFILKIDGTRTINGSGYAFAQTPVVDEEGNPITQDCSIYYVDDDNVEKLGNIDENGLLTIEWYTSDAYKVLDPNGKAKDKTVIFKLYYVNEQGEHNESTLLPIKVSMDIHVSPLSFKQTWEMTDTLGASFNEGLDISINDLDLVRIGGSASGEIGIRVGLEHGYSNGVRTFKIENSYNPKMSFGLSGGESDLIDEDGVKWPKIFKVLPNVSGSIAQGATWGQGVEISGYDPTNKNQIDQIGLFMILSGAIAQGDYWITTLTNKALKNKDKDIYAIKSNSMNVSVKGGVELGVLDLGDHVTGSLLNNSYSASLSSTLSRKTNQKGNSSVTIKSDQSTGNTSSFGNFNVKYNPNEMLAKDNEKHPVNSSKFAIFTKENAANKCSVSYSADDWIGGNASLSITTTKAQNNNGGILFYNRNEKEDLTYTYSGDNFNKIRYGSGDLSKFCNNGNLIAGSSYERIFDFINRSDATADYKRSLSATKNVSLPLSVSAGVWGLSFTFAGGTSTSYDFEKGQFSDGTPTVHARMDIEDAVKNNEVSVIDIISEAVSSAAKVYGQYIVDAAKNVSQGVKNGYATAKAAIDTSLNWTLHILSLGNGADTMSLNMNEYGVKLTTYASYNAEDLQEENASSGWAIGMPYEIYMTNETEEQVDDFSDLPVDLSIDYDVEMLENIGLTEADAIHLAIYQYAQEYKGYVYIGGDVDLENHCVSTQITKPGQYILSIDVEAPVIETFSVSDTSTRPVFTVQLHNELDFKSVSFTIDGKEIVNNSNWKKYYQANLNRFVIPCEENLVYGAHIAEIYLVDSAGNEMEAPVSLKFYVDIDEEQGLTDENVPDGLWVSGINPYGYTYTGSKIVPQIKVYDGKTLLKNKKDYTISIKNNINAFEYEETDPEFSGLVNKAPVIIVKGKGNYKGTEKVYFKIIPKGFSVDKVSYNYSSYIANGKKQYPNPTIQYDGKKLTKDKDYSIAYHKLSYDTNEYEPVDAIEKEGSYQMIITGINGYASPKGKTVYDPIKISIFVYPSTYKDISKLKMTKIKSYSYTGEPIVPKVTIGTLKGISYEEYYNLPYEDRTTYDFTYSYSSNVKAGTAYIYINGVNNYVGHRTERFTITGKNLSKAKITGIPASIAYSEGNPITPEFNVTYTTGKGKTAKTDTLKGVTVDELNRLNSARESTDNIDFYYSFTNNKDVGTAELKIYGYGGYTGSKSVKFKISGVSMKNISVGSLTNQYYNGFEIEENGVLTYKDATLEKGKDYIVSYKKNSHTKVGKVEVTYKGIGLYSGSIKKTFKILQHSVTAADIQVEEDVTSCYTKGGAKPDVNIILGGYKLVNGKDYTLTYSNNKAVTDSNTVSKPTITINGKGNFIGSKTITFTIIPKSINSEAVTVKVTDKLASTTAGAWKSAVTIVDEDGKKLESGKDFEITQYETETLEEPIVLSDADVVAAAEGTGTYIKVSISALGTGYTGQTEAIYRIYEKDISKLSVKPITKEYRNAPVKLTKADIQLLTGKLPLEDDSIYEIDSSSYSNNIKRSKKASVNIVGVGTYGGTKKITFSIGLHGLKWFTQLFK